MAKSIRSKSKKKFREIKRQKLAKWFVKKAENLAAKDERNDQTPSDTTMKSESSVVIIEEENEPTRIMTTENATPTEAPMELTKVTSGIRKTTTAKFAGNKKGRGKIKGSGKRRRIVSKNARKHKK